MRTPLILGTIAAALAVAVALLLLGPSNDVVCGSGNALDQLAQDIMQPLGAGHIDGPSATLCTVPASVTWFVAIAGFAVTLTIGMLLTRRTGARVHS